jgi:hypothetical protein
MDLCKRKDYLRGSDITLSQITRMKIEEFSCPRNKTYKVRGNFLDQDYSQIRLSIARCNPKVSKIPCKSDKEINALVTQLEVQFVFTNANFD